MTAPDRPKPLLRTPRNFSLPARKEPASSIGSVSGVRDPTVRHKPLAQMLSAFNVRRQVARSPSSNADFPRRLGGGGRSGGEADEAISKDSAESGAKFGVGPAAARAGISFQFPAAPAPGPVAFTLSSRYRPVRSAAPESRACRHDWPDRRCPPSPSARSAWRPCCSRCSSAAG